MDKSPKIEPLRKNSSANQSIQSGLNNLEIMSEGTELTHKVPKPKLKGRAGAVNLSGKPEESRKMQRLSFVR